MVKTFTPIVGLAVVMALALAAVFGSMSLANPAMAAIGQPADAELTERVDSPQAAPQVSAKGADSSATVSWKPATIAGDAQEGNALYQIRWRAEDETFTSESWKTVEDASVGLSDATPADLSATTPVPNVSVVVGSLANGKMHYFQVRLIDRDTTATGSQPGSADEATAIPAKAPDQADDLTVTAGTRQVTLNWDDPDDDTITRWEYFQNEAEPTNDGLAADGANWREIGGSTASTTSHVVTRLASGKTYHFAVRALAHDTPGVAASSDEETSENWVSIELEPGLIEGLKATPADKAVDLKWDATADPGVYRYEYRYKMTSDADYGGWMDVEEADPDFTAPTTIPATTNEVTLEAEATAEATRESSMVTVPTLSNGVSYTFQVRAVASVSGLSYQRDATSGVVPEAEADRESSTPVTREDEDMESSKMATPAMPMPSTLKKDGIPDQTVGVGKTLTVDLFEFYNDGVGIGAIGMFTVRVSGDTVDVNASDEMGATDSSFTTESGMINIVGLGEGIAVVSVMAADKESGSDFTDPMLDSFTVTVGEGETGTPIPPEELAMLPLFEQSSNDPGDSGNYDVKFQVTGLTSPINTRTSDLIIEFHEDYGIPASIRNTSVAITTKLGSQPEVTFTPEDVTVDGEKVLLSLGDMDERDDRFDYEIDPDEVINVHFRQSAGITTATEQDTYFLVEITFGAYGVEYDEDAETPAGLTVDVFRKISLSEEDGGLGDVIEATGKGYKNGTTLTVYRDMVDTVVMWDHDGDEATIKAGATPTARVPLKPADRDNWMAKYSNVSWLPDADYPNADGNLLAPSGSIELGEDVLCVANIGGNDVGTCEFTVTHPTFLGGNNYVNAVDGRDQYSGKPDSFNLEASIQARPASGSPGESIVVQIVDFPRNHGITSIQISRDSRIIPCVGSCSTDQNGAASFSIIIPNWVKSGTQDLRVSINMGTAETPNWVRAGTTVDLAGPRVVSTPQTVVANQRLSLVGTGFSPNAELGDDTQESRAISKVSVGGYEVPWSKINDGRNVSVDDSGNWSASLDLPLVEATTGTGERLLRVTDSFGRTGVVVLNLTERNFDVTPPSGRVGTLAVVRGVGYPGKNDEGDSFTIDVTYKVQEGTETRVSVVPDASGRFEVQLRIPTTAPIPSTNQVEVTFEHEVGGTKVTDVKQHSIPEGLITTSVTSGGPGSMVTLNGEGFKTYAPVESVKIGAIDITPAPRPHTDANGMMEFDILVPGLDVGIQTIEVKVGGTTSSTGFTVTESGVNPGDIKATAVAIEELGDNLVSVWNFNNDTKVWSFYDPTLAEGNTLTHMITGETYLIRIKSDVEVILNRDTRNLTCVGSNCWNQVVW